MKKQFTFCFIFSIAYTTLILTSCNSDNELISTKDPLPSTEQRTLDSLFHQTELANSNQIELVQSWLLQKGNLRSIDLNNSIITTKLSTNIKSIHVKFEDQKDWEKQVVLLLENDSIAGVI